MLSGLLLIYTAVVAPVQICLWSYEDPCNMFPTLYFDVAVDSFFLVTDPRALPCARTLRSRIIITLPCPQCRTLISGLCHFDPVSLCVICLFLASFTQ